MKFGIGILPSPDINQTLSQVKIAEINGFEYAWIFDKYDGNIFNTIRNCIIETESIRIGPGVTNPYLNSPQKIANEMSNIWNLSPDRTMLGIGPGDKDKLSQKNIEWKQPYNTLEKAINIIKSEFNQNNKIPIYLEAQSQKLLKLSREKSDGVLINSSYPKYYEKIIRNNPDLEINAFTTTSINNDSQIAKNAARIIVTFIIAGSSPQFLEEHNVPKLLSGKIYTNLYAGNVGGSISLVNNSLIDKFSITGTSYEVISKIEEMEKMGVSQFIAGPPIGKNIEESIRLFGEVISTFG